MRELWPLYRELHTWMRYELAQRYGVSAPYLITCLHTGCQTAGDRTGVLQ